MLQLVSKTSTGKIKIVLYDCFWDDELHGFKITRKSGQFKGKVIEHPTLEIKRGKVNRTAQEQCNLEYNHLIKEKLDKGYKIWEKPLEDTTEQELQEFLGEVVTNQTGVPKPMLAKQADKVNNVKIYDKEWYISRKINGVRCLLFLDSNGDISTASRGAIDYNIAMSHFIINDKLINFFKKHPNLILDGEIYKHGLDLNEISALSRSRQNVVDGDILEFYWYDIADTNKPFKSRLDDILLYKNELNLSFDPYKVWNKNDLQIQVVPHELVSGWNNMKQIHDKFVSEGWEGAVIRDPDKVYKPNGRSNDMIKIKEYDTITCKVVGIEQGLREYDDMVFVCEMPGDEGKLFKAKPLGNRDQKIEYTTNFNSTYKGIPADIKYFNFSAHGVVEQPCLVCFRWDLIN